MPGTDPGRVLVEICVDDVAGACLAAQEGADRIELCAALSEGGLTPSLGLVQTVLSAVSRLGVQVMIRPRGGNFVLEEHDLDVMLADIAALRALRLRPGVTLGFVFGALTPEGALDEPALQALRDAAADAPTTLHKAFDAIGDQPRALERLIGLGIGRVLTSGGAATAEAGIPALAALVRQAGDRIAIIAGGGVRPANVSAIVERTGVREVHGRAMAARAGRAPATERAAIAALLRPVRAA